MSKILFNDHNIESGISVWIVEGIWDAIRLWSFGENVIATFGAHLSDVQALLVIKKYRMIKILYDGDKAGRNGAVKIQQILSPYLTVVNVALRFGDPGELYRKEFMDMKRGLNE